VTLDIKRSSPGFFTSNRLHLPLSCLHHWAFRLRSIGLTVTQGCSTPLIFHASGIRMPSPTSICDPADTAYTRFITKFEAQGAVGLDAILDKEFFAQDLPKSPPKTESASELISEGLKIQ
jgi:hypothetical protein